MRLPWLALLAVLAPAAHAARPMITDDARITDPQACQLETWVQVRKNAHDFWALPACNPGGNFELTMGGALAHADGSAQSGAVQIQGKTLFKNVETNSWGLGIAGGYATQPGKGQSGSPYFYLPGSLSLADDRVVLHANLGAIRLHEIQETRMTWGLGSETASTERLYVIAEAFGLNVGRPSIQAGLRYWIVPGHVQVDTTVGSNLDDFQGNRWLSIGLRLISPPIF
jgi:hypothetical protein